jgi:hypothetical protein
MCVPGELCQLAQRVRATLEGRPRALGYLLQIGSSPAGQDQLSLIAYTPTATVVLPLGMAHAVVAGFNQEGIGPFSQHHRDDRSHAES